MIFNIQPHERKIFELISLTGKEMGVDVYVVGGYVRDRLLNIPSKDMDIVCIGDGIKFAQQVAYKLRPIPKIVVYKRFGTALIKHQDLEIEFVGARKESYREDSRKPEVNAGTLEDDQNRRDFTINSLAVSLKDENYGEIVDPFGGIYHLEQKTVKTPLEPGRTFSDDPLRMMRAIRFACKLNFEIEEKTLKALSTYKNRIKIVSQERITGELQKMLSSHQPSIGFKILFDSGILAIIFPQMARLYGVDYKNGMGHKDNFYHTLEVLDNVCKKTDNIWLRWAAVLHDIAKPPTKRFNEKSGWTFHGHEVLGATMVPKIFRKLRLPLDHKMKYVQKLVRLHLRPISLTKENITDSAIRRLLFDAGDDIDDLMLLCEADITSKNPKKVQRYLSNYILVRDKLKEVEQKDHLRNWEPPVTGDMIMEAFGITPSRNVGIIKTAIREAILDGLIPNEHDDAWEYMLQKGKDLGLSPVESKSSL